jgi:hypothetical protein
MEKLNHLFVDTGQAVQGAPARTGHWLRILLRRRFVKALMVASLVALLLVPLREAGWLQGLELSSYDRLVTFFAGSQESDRVVLVVTTEADINRFGYPSATTTCLPCCHASSLAGRRRWVWICTATCPCRRGTTRCKPSSERKTIFIGFSSCRMKAISAFRRRRCCVTLAARCWPTT